MTDTARITQEMARLYASLPEARLVDQEWHVANRSVQDGACRAYLAYLQGEISR